AIVGIGGEDASDGPLSMRVAGLPALLAALRGCEGIPFESSEGMLYLGGVGRVSLDGARTWTPVMPSRMSESAARQRAMEALVNLIAMGSTREGCAPIAPHIVALYEGDPLPPWRAPVA